MIHKPLVLKLFLLLRNLQLLSVMNSDGEATN